MTRLYISLAAFCVLLGCTTAISHYYMDLNCGNTIDFDSILMDNMRLKLTSRSSYQKNMDCTLVLRTSSLSFTDKFMLYFKNIDIESNSGCTNDYLEVRDGSTSSSQYVSGLYGRQCGYYISNGVFKTTGNYLYLRFKSDNSLQLGGFDMIITKYHTGVCYSEEYDCDNGRCISDTLTCNGYNPCGDYSDCPLAAGAIAGIVVGSIFFVVILTIVIIVFRRRRIRYARSSVAVVSGATNSYGTNVGYNQPVPAQYPAPAYPGSGQQYPPGQQYPTGQQYPPQYPN